MLPSKYTDFQTHLSKIQADIYLDKRRLIAVTYLLFVAAQGIVTLRSDMGFNLNAYILYGLAFYFYYQKQDSLKFTDNITAQVLGALLLLLPAFKLFTLYRVDSPGFWAIAPPMASLGLILLADGFHGIKQFWRLLFGIIFISGVFTRIQWLLQNYANLNVLSAKFSAYFLWMIGFEAATEGTIVYVNDGAIDIFTGCTVFPMLFACVELLVIVWLFFPKTVPNIFTALIVAFVITFPLSIIRLGIMALVVNNPVDFNYWHGTQGSNIFMSVSLITFGLFILINSPDDFGIKSNVWADTLDNRRPTWLVSLVTVTSTLIFIVLILLPQGGSQNFSSYQLPQTINLEGWTLQTSNPLSLAEMSIAVETEDSENDEVVNLTAKELLTYQQAQTNVNTLMAGQRYLYQDNNSVLTTTLRYVVNANGGFPGIRSSEFAEFDIDAFRQQTETPLHHDEFLIFSDDSKLHLISCITPKGKSVTNPRSMILSDRIRHTLSNPLNIYQWLLGNRLIWDRRCVWVHLSHPSNRPNAQAQLEQAWRQLLEYFRVHYPKI